MPGHRRKVSNSTVATVDNSRTKWLPETAILKPLKNIEANENSDQWPCFVLTDATVYLKDGKRMANPLLPDGPFVVRGQVHVDDKEKDQREALINPRVKSAYVEIQGSMMYSIAVDPVVVWCGGACGWYEIRPSAQFEEIYEQMREAIVLYYAILDVFEASAEALEVYRQMPKSQRKRMREPTIDLDEVLLKYAVAVGDGMFRHEAEERCHKWAPFLINQFPKENEFTWSGTFFYTWIISKHPDVYKKALKRAAEEERQKKAAATAKAPAPHRSVESLSRASSEISHSKSTRSRKESLDIDVDMKDAPPASPLAPQRQSSVKSGKLSKSPVGTPQSLPAQIVRPTRQAVQQPSPATLSQDSQSAEVLAPVDVLVEALEEIASNHNGPLQKISRSSVSSRLYFNFKISNYNASSEILAYFSKELVQKLDAKWHPSPFYQWLEKESRQTSRELIHTDLKKMPGQLVRRNKKQVAAPTAAATSQTPSLQIPSKARPPSDDEDLDSDEGHSSTRPRHAGKGGLRLHSASKKRTASEMLEDDPSSGGRGRKPAKTSHYYADNPDDSDAAALSDNASSEAGSQQPESEDPDGLLVPPPKDAVRIVVHAEKLPSMSPSGPNGTWVCDQDDCGYVVRAAEEAAGKRLIQQHFRDHEARTEKVSLALREAGRMPINHLLEKIQALGKKSLDKGEIINGEIVPLPVKRRLVV